MTLGRRFAKGDTVRITDEFPGHRWAGTEMKVVGYAPDNSPDVLVDIISSTSRALDGYRTRIPERKLRLAETSERITEAGSIVGGLMVGQRVHNRNTGTTGRILRFQGDLTASVLADKSGKAVTWLVENLDREPDFAVGERVRIREEHKSHTLYGMVLEVVGYKDAGRIVVKSPSSASESWRANPFQDQLELIPEDVPEETRVQEKAGDTDLADMSDDELADNEAEVFEELQKLQEELARVQSAVHERQGTLGAIWIEQNRRRDEKA